MSLEDKIANWVELGVMSYEEAMNIQKELVDLRERNMIRDTILSVQHPTTVSFGASKKDNQFSERFLDEVKKEYGNTSQESALKYLAKKGIPFSLSKRGGGATVFSPGQFVFYPIVKQSDITGSPKRFDLQSYKTIIYGSLFDALNNLGVEGINVGSQSSFNTREERRDAWIVRDGITHKMGSKGIGLSRRDVTYHGFALYGNKNGIADSWIVNQCGYKPHEVKLWSVEQELGRPVKPEEVYASVKKAIAKNFGYEGFNGRSLDELSRRRPIWV